MLTTTIAATVTHSHTLVNRKSNVEQHKAKTIQRRIAITKKFNIFFVLNWYDGKRCGEPRKECTGIPNARNRSSSIVYV